MVEYLKGACVVLANHEWASELPRLIACFGTEKVVREYAVTMTPADTDHHRVLDSYNNLRAIISVVPGATTRAEARLAGAKRALALRRSMDSAHGDLHPMGAPWLRSGNQLEALLPGRQELIHATVTLANDLAFTVDLVAPELPDFLVPHRHTEMSLLREKTLRRTRHRYATRPPEIRAQAHRQIDHELNVIEQLNFPGYFLIVCDLVDFCVEANIVCQGRGSAASSTVCFFLGITNAEPIGAGLLFERFLSLERDGPLDIDIESGRREEVIQYVYATYGRDRAAQVTNVITYRRKGALRDRTRALGYPKGVEDGTRVRVAGVVTHRQRPQTTAGLIFLGLEDETGLINAMISVGLWKRQKKLARTARALVIHGKVQNQSGAVTLVADQLGGIDVGQWLTRGSRDVR